MCSASQTVTRNSVNVAPLEVDCKAVFQGLEIVGISRVGHDYVLHFSNGSYGVFAADDLKLLLGDDLSCLLINKQAVHLA